VIEKDHISLASVVEIAGVQLKNAGGKRLKGICPFHPDTDPSFIVYPDNRWRCFGCGLYGDVVDFVQEMYQCDFKGALKVLGISQDEAPEKIQQKVRAAKKARQEKADYKKAIIELYDEVSLLARTTRLVLSGIETEQDMEERGELFHFLANLEYHESILLGDDEQLKGMLLQEQPYINKYYTFTAPGRAGA